MDDLVNIVFSSSLSKENITEIIVNAGKQSSKIQEINSAEEYFNTKNEEISKKERTYYDKDGIPHNNPKANNARIKSNFLRELVEQKQDYGFAKPFIFRLSDENEVDIDLSENDYGKEWKKFLDDVLYKFSSRLAGQAINRGLAWAYIRINENGELEIKDVDARLIYPVWSDSQHTKIDKLVYNYVLEVYESMSPTSKEYAEYWTDKERILYEVSDDYKEISAIKNEDNTPVHSHMMNENGEEFSWDKIPFIALKGTDDEKTLLSFIKEQIDSYDKIDSVSVDGLVDELDPTLVLKGISSDIDDIVEARELLKMTKTMSCEADGDAKFIQAELNIEQHIKEKLSLRRDIINFGYGVDYEDARFGGNPNQMVIKSLFQKQDTYVDGLERRFQEFMENLKYFFDKWYEFTGKGSFEDAQKYKILIKLDRSMMFNKSAEIEDCVKLGNTGISKKTLLENNPVVQDVDVELERLAEEKKEQQKEQEEYTNKLFKFQNEENEDAEDDESEDKIRDKKNK